MSAAIILAAGKSTRMKSETPKVLHEVCGRPMIEHVLDAAREAGVERLIVVVGHKADVVQEALSGHDDVDFVLQAEQLGTGHAVMVCEPQLKDHDGSTLVLAGDTPLLRGSSLRGLLDVLTDESAKCVVGSAVTENNDGLGRIVRNDTNDFERIVEQKDATPKQLEITEINTGCYAFDNQALFDSLKSVRPENNQAEYYLTDCAEILKDQGQRVVAAAKLDIEEAMGVNTQDQLAEVSNVLEQRSVSSVA